MIKSSKTFTWQQKYGQRTILQQTNNFYSVDTARMIIDTFTVSKQVIKRGVSVPTWPYFYDYDIYRYWRYFGFLKQDSIIQKTYANTDSMVNKIIFASYNSQNYKPNTILSYSSAGEAKSIRRIGPTPKLPENCPARSTRAPTRSGHQKTCRWMALSSWS